MTAYAAPSGPYLGTASKTTATNLVPFSEAQTKKHSSPGPISQTKP